MQKTTLIIDDEEEICQLLVSYLKRKNYETHYALTLKEGLEKCKAILPELIFLDNNLPDGYGISDISTIKEIIPSTKIVVISAMTNLADKAISAGAFGFIGKPISFQNIDAYT